MAGGERDAKQIRLFPKPALNSVPPALVELFHCKLQLSFFLVPSAEAAARDSPSGLCAGGPLGWDSPHLPCCSLGKNRVVAIETQGRRSSPQCMGRIFPC